MADATTTCLLCRAELPGGARFCPQCGSAQSNAGTTLTELADTDRPLLPPRVLPAGTRLGQVYTVEALVGEGGMAAVYRARDSARGRTVAIKVLHPNLLGESGIRRRFAREARIMTEWHHPHVVRAYDYVTDGELCALVMEYVAGRSLAEYLDQWGGPLPLAQIRDIFAGVLDAIASAHDRGIVHRDLKPHNILLETTDVEITAKVVDFGITKVLEGTAYTVTGAILGTCLYMSPEQVKNPDRVDHRSDIYSLGVTLYHALTGRRPFESSSQYSLMMAHVSQAPPPPSRHHDDIPPDLEALVLAALAKEPENRPQTCIEFRDRLLASLAEVAAASRTLAGASEPRPALIEDTDGTELVLIPAGTFLMGPSRRTVYLDDFYLARHPVTNRQFHRFLQVTGYRPTDAEAKRFLSHWRGGQYPRAQADHPVANISWLDAQAYCRWAGRRLPSEAEWEKAARGTDGRKYPWGKTEPTAERAHFGRALQTTVEVGSHPGGASPYGILDQAGNIGEWCEDIDDPRFYLSGPDRNPRNTAGDGERRVVRGGGWMYGARSLRTYARQSFQPTYRIAAVGFRVAL